MADNPLVTYFALYRADKAGPVDGDEGVCSICVGLFGDYEEAITLARENLAEGYSISIDLGVMTTDEWDAIDEVPDDFSPSISVVPQNARLTNVADARPPESPGVDGGDRE
jgi:hypothetical protein